MTSARAVTGVRHAFARATGYHQRAVVQRRVAGQLAARLGELPLPPRPRILELGCGTGFLSTELQKQWPDGHLLLTDLAPAMVARCRAHGAHLPGCPGFAAMDGEHPAVAPGWDLITASLAFQWFGDLTAALHGFHDLLAPGGWLGFATLGEGTFAEWRRACAQAGVPCGTPRYPGAGELARCWPGGAAGVTETLLRVPYADGLAFVRELGAIGARTPVVGYPAQGPAPLRRVLRTLDHEWSVTYHILTAVWRRP